MFVYFVLFVCLSFFFVCSRKFCLFCLLSSKHFDYEAFELLMISILNGNQLSFDELLFSNKYDDAHLISANKV